MTLSGEPKSLEAIGPANPSFYTTLLYKGVISPTSPSVGNICPLSFCHVNICYGTIMFGQVTHTLDAAAMRVHSFVYVIHIL